MTAVDRSNGLEGVLAERLDPAAAPARRWEDRHTRWTVWVRTDLREQIEAHARATGRSLREVVDELLTAGLDQTSTRRPPGRPRR